MSGLLLQIEQSMAKGEHRDKDKLRIFAYTNMGFLTAI